MNVAGKSIRPGDANDLPSLAALYNHYVETTPITFDLDPFTPQEREPWFRQFSRTGPHRLLVAGDDQGLCGYACSTPLKPRGAYATSVEFTIYLLPEACGQGLGRKLYSALTKALNGEDIHRAYGYVTLPNAASEKLHESHSFREVGLFNEVGRKFGRYWDVKLYERRF